MWQGTLFSLLSGISFGLLGVLVKLGYAENMPVGLVLQCRFLFGAAFMFLFLVGWRRRLLRLDLPGLAMVAAIGMVVYYAQSSFFFRSVEYLPVTTSVLILYGYPVTVTLLSAVLYRLHLTWLLVLSLILVSSGCGLICYDAFLRELNPTGLLYAFGHLGCFTLYLLLVQKVMKGRHPLSVSFYMILFTGLSFLLQYGPGTLASLRLSNLPMALGLGFIPTTLAITLLFLAIERIGSAHAAIFSSSEPVAALVSAHLVLGEPIVMLQVMGMALILAGVVLPNLKTAAILGKTRMTSGNIQAPGVKSPPERA